MSVKRMVSLGLMIAPLIMLTFRTCVRVFTVILARKGLDKHDYDDIIVFTSTRRHALATTTAIPSQHQTPDAPPSRYSQPASRSGHLSSVSERRLLRCRRSR